MSSAPQPPKHYSSVSYMLHTSAAHSSLANANANASTASLLLSQVNLRRSTSLTRTNSRGSSGSSSSSSSAIFTRTNSKSSTVSSSTYSSSLAEFGGGGANSVQGALKDLFRHCDVDKSGGLNRSEFARLLEKCSFKQINASAVFGFVDVDGDSEIDYDEFLEWVESPDTCEGACRNLTHVLAADRVLRYVRSTLSDSRIVQNNNSRLENLQKRFPAKANTEISRALFRAHGHGGEAAAVLSGKMERPSFKTTKLGSQFMSELDGTAGHLSHMYGL